MNRLHSILFACCIALAAAANAANSYEHVPAMYQSAISRDQAIAMVQSKYGARVMKADTVQEDGRMIYYIRLMSQDRSRVWTVRVDAATGREM